MKYATNVHMNKSYTVPPTTVIIYVELAGLPAPPTSHTLYIYPFHPSPAFPLSKLYCWKLRNSPDLS